MKSPMMQNPQPYPQPFEILEAKVILWARGRNLIKGSDPKSQLLKTMAELGELADGINKQREAEIADGIGDVIVTLIIIAEMYGMSLPGCLELAYDEIKDRRGRMVDGVFIKEGDV